MTTRYDTIFGGIFRGISKNKRSFGISDHNVTKDNPLSTQWIGQSTTTLQAPIEKEQTQSPAIPWDRRSVGLGFSYQQPMPTDFGRAVAPNYYQSTDTGYTWQPSRNGSLVQSMPSEVPLANMHFNGLGMAPMNGQHFREYFADQFNTINLVPKPNPTNVLTAVAEDSNKVLDGSADVWRGHWSVLQSGTKGYSPANAFRGF